MSQNYEDDKLQRSIKLNQLVYDRQIDNEIGFDIRKLLEEGVLIDFQDQNRNRKTALHLAVEKCDVNCVKFLLRLKPNLEVKDEDGKTPVELAESSGNHGILNILLSSTVDVINESNVEVIDYESLTRQKVEAIKSRPTFKVLKLTNCPKVNDVWMKLNDHAYTTAFNESSLLFFIAIEARESDIQNNHKLMKKVLNIQRPMIVQLSSSDSRNTKIYFKDDKKDFVEISETTQITQKEFSKSVQSDDGCNLKLLVAALRSNLFGHFTSDLLDTKLNTNESRSEAVNQFARSNALCHRFFKLFDESQPEVNRIVAALSFEGDQSLLALLDLPFEFNEKKLKLTEYQQDIVSVVNDRGYNLLMMAAEHKNLDAIKLLLRCNCDFNHSDNYEKRASDICREKKAFDCLAELIEAGAPYPKNFSTNATDEKSEAYKRINAMTEAINSFHASIGDGEIEEVKKFTMSHPHIKHAYDTNNKSALTVALQSNKIDIHSLLMSEGFEPGADDEYQNSCSKSSHKNEIRNSNRKYFKEAFNEAHLKRLFEMSRLSFGSKDRAKCSAIIRKMFDELNEIDEIIPILQVCSLSDKLRIVFDFNCDSIVDMDSTKDSSTLGIVYPSDGFVYIGAKNYKTEFYKVIGHLIHEMTHYAMKLAYGNGCKPYSVNDIALTNRFEIITTETRKICDKNPSTDPIVATVFNLYDQGVWHQELIVRVPHLLAHNKTNPIVLETAARNNPELFHFYREKTLKDVERKSKALLQKYLISKINKQTGIVQKIENLNVEFENVKITLKSSVNVITSNAPQLTLAMLRQVYEPDSHIFVTLEQIEIGNILDKIAKINVKESSTALIVDCIGQARKYPGSLRKLMKSVKKMKTIALIMTEAETSKMKESFPEVDSKTFTHKWGELTESTKVHVLKQNVIFQGFEMKLGDLVKPSSEAMNFFPFCDILKADDFNIGNDLHQTSHKFYIPRKFIRKGQESLPRVTKKLAKSFEEFRVESKMGVMIISDEAGSGKSVTLFEIAKSFNDSYPDRWVQFVDLKRHIEAFKRIENHEKVETFEDFISENILKNEPKFDRELFKQMFRTGKTFVLFDGFDEICPNYKGLLLNALKLFQPGSGNQLFITTRPHLEADLKHALGNFVFKLEKFSEESQINFLAKYFKSVGFELSSDDFEVLSNRLLEKFSKIKRSEFIGLPLLMRMTAEIFEDPIKLNLLHEVDSSSIFSVVSKFIEKYLVRWSNNESEISRSETVEFVMAGGVLAVHHKIAINHIFDEEDFMKFEADENDAEKISRVGLIRYDKSEKTYQFVHETFAEYFVADFIWFHLNRKNRDQSHDCRLAVEILIEILVAHVDFGVIRNFFDETLKSRKFSPSQQFCKSVAKCFSGVLKSRNRFDFLRSLVTSPEHLANLLLLIVRHVDKELLLEMLQSKASFDGSSALLIAAASGSDSVVSTLCNLITTCTDNPKEIFQVNDLHHGNVLLRAASNRNRGILSTLCASLNSVFTKDEMKILFKQKAIAIAANNSNDEVFCELLSLLPKYFSPDEIKSLLLAVDSRNQNFFHQAVNCNAKKNLKINIDVIKSNFCLEEQKIFFYQPATALNMFLCAAQNRNEKIFETLIECTKDVLSSYEIKSMLMEKDSDGSNVLHIIAEHGNEIVLNELNSLLRERLSDEKIRSLLLEVNSNGQNCFRLAANNTKLNLQSFCEIIGNLLSIKDQTRLLQQSIQDIDIIRLACGINLMGIVPDATIKELLAKKDQKGRNVFQVVASKNEVETWNKLVSFAQAIFSVDEIKLLLFGCDSDGEDCLKLAVSGSARENMIEAIYKTIKVVLSVEDQKMLVKQRDPSNRNVFHHAAANFDGIKFLSLYDCLSSILSIDEIKEMLKEKDSEGNNILICSNGKSPVNDGKSYDLLRFLRKILTSDEIKTLFFDVDHGDRNFFHWAVEFSSKATIKSSRKAIKKILSHDEQKIYFGSKKPNVFHLAVRNPICGIFSTLHGCLKEVLTDDEIKSLILEKNSESKNVLHLLCQQEANGNENNLCDLLKVLTYVCDADKLKNFLLSSDNHGSNILLLAAQFKDQFFFKKLISFTQSELEFDDQRDLFQKCDDEGKNIFTCASVNKSPKFLSFVGSYAKEILSKYQIKEQAIKMRRYSESESESETANSFENKEEKRAIKDVKKEIGLKSLRKFLKLSHQFQGDLVESQNYSKLKALIGRCPESNQFIPFYTEKCRKFFEDNLSFKSGIFPPRSIIEVRPAFLCCGETKTGAINEDQGSGEGGPNIPMLRNSKTLRYPNEFKNDKVSSRKSESLSLDVDCKQGEKKELDLEIEFGDQRLLATFNKTRLPPESPDPGNHNSTRPPPQPPDPDYQNSTLKPPQSHAPDHQNPTRPHLKLPIPAHKLESTATIACLPRQSKPEPTPIYQDRNRVKSEELFIERQLIVKNGKNDIVDLKNLTCDSEHRIVILSGERFTGKTTILLRYLVTQKASRVPNSIIYVDLKHIKNVGGVRFNSSQKIADYLCLCSEYLRNKSASAQQEFVTSFIDNNAIILLDSLDDESLNHLNLIEAIINNTENQLWVAIRPNLEEIIETDHEIEIFEIQDFSPDKQKEFIRQKLNNPSEKNFSLVCRKIDGCLKFLPGNLLLLQCFLATFETITHPISGGNYFYTFTKMMEKYIEMIQIQCEVTLTMSNLQKIAFRSTFKQSQEAINLVEELFEEALNETKTMNQSGLGYFKENDFFSFTNPRIAEFLIAHYLFFNFFMNETQVERAWYLLEISARVAGIRKFLDDAFQPLTNKSYSAQRENISLNVERIFSHKNLHNIFHTLLGDGLKILVVNISSLFNCKSLTLKKLWHYEDPLNRNIIMIAAHHLPVRFLKEILDCARRVVDLNVFMSLHDYQKRTVFSYAKMNKEAEIIETLINSLNSADHENQEKCLATLLGLKDEQTFCWKKFKDIPKSICDKFGAVAVSIHLLTRNFHSLDELFDSFSPFLNENTDTEEFLKAIQNKLKANDDLEREQFFSYRVQEADQTRNAERTTESTQIAARKTCLETNVCNKLSTETHETPNTSSDKANIESEEKQDVKDSGKNVETQEMKNSKYSNQNFLSNQQSCQNVFISINVIGRRASARVRKTRSERARGSRARDF